MFVVKSDSNGGALQGRDVREDNNIALQGASCQTPESTNIRLADGLHFPALNRRYHSRPVRGPFASICRIVFPA
jgi:hypothetical protein